MDFSCWHARPGVRKIPLNQREITQNTPELSSGPEKQRGVLVISPLNESGCYRMSLKKIGAKCQWPYEADNALSGPVNNLTLSLIKGVTSCLAVVLLDLPSAYCTLVDARNPKLSKKQKMIDSDHSLQIWRKPGTIFLQCACIPSRVKHSDVQTNQEKSCCSGFPS